MSTPGPRGIRRGTLSVDGATVGYHWGGQGRVTVVVGSIAQSASLCLPLLSRLVATGAVLAVDPPGYGLSGPSEGDTSIEGRAGWLDRVLVALGVAQATLVGRHSGGLVALALSGTAPDRYLVVILDRTPLLGESERRRWGAQYAPEIPAVLDGGHLSRHWMLRRLELLYAPWFDAPDGVPLEADLTGSEALDDLMHAAVLDRLAAGDIWADPYRAMFAYDPAPVLQAPATRVVVLAENGPRALRTPGAGSVLDGSGLIGDPVTVVLPPPGVGRDDMLVSLVERHGPTAATTWTSPARPPADRRAWTVELASTPWGQVVVRRHDAPGRPGRRPLVMLHASPLSGVSLLPLAAAFTPSRPVVVVDTLGAGDSDRPDVAAHPQLRNPRIEDYAAVVGAAIDDLGIEAVDLYGTHTGAVIAIELAISRPDLVQNLVVNGVPLFDPDGVDDTLSDYFIDLSPRWDGGHLAAAWSFTVEVMLWFPWHVRDGAHRRLRPNLDPAALHERFVQLLKGGVDYAKPQRAALVHPTRSRLPDVAVRTLVCSSPGDPLGPDARDVTRLVAGAEHASLSGTAQDALMIVAWLDAGGQERKTA